MKLVFSVLLLIVGGYILYLGIGLSMKSILGAIVSSANMVVKVVKDKPAGEETFDFQLPIILTVVGFLISGVGMSFLVAFLTT